MPKIEFNSFTREIDGQGYCSAVETYASNILEENESEATIIYPGEKKFISFRSEDWRITTDSLYMILPYPLYKIVSLKIKPNGLKIANLDYATWVN